MTVDATGVLDRTVWFMGDGSQVTCQGSDAPYVGYEALNAGAAAAQQAVAGSGMTGTVQVAGTTVTVTCTAQYGPVLLATGTWDVDATDSARAVRGITEEG